MHYLLYLRRSLTRCPRRHISLCLILTCAFLLPLIVSIYRDTVAYGASQELLTRSKGMTYHIQNVTGDDCQYFTGIDGLSDPVYEDGTIYLKIEDEEVWKNQEKAVMFDFLLMQRMEDVGLASAVVTGYDYYSAHGISVDEQTASDLRTLLVINIVLIAFSALIVQSTYRNHLQRFSADMKTLSLCGASWRQIDTIFWMELIAAYVVSSICALAVSIGVLKVLFWLFLEVRDVEGMATLIFHVDVKNTAFHLLVYFLCLAAALCYSLMRFHKDPTLSAGDVSPDKIRKKQLRICSTPAKSLAGLWRQRTNKVLRGCVWISAPIMFIALFLFEYQMLDIDYLTGESEYEIIVSNYSEGFTDSDIDYVQAMEEVEYVDTYRDSVIYSVEVLRETQDGQESLGIHSLYLRQLDSASGSANALGEYEVALSKNCTEIAASVGEKLKLLNPDEDGTLHYIKTIPELVVTNLVDKSASEGTVEAYVSEELLKELGIPAKELRLKLRSADSHQLVEQALQSRFSGAEYEIRNNQTKADYTKERFSKGVYLLLIYIFAILFLLAVLILYVKLQEYVNDCTEFARELYIIGASKRTLHRSFLMQTAASVVPAAAIPAVCSLVVAWRVAKSINMSLSMNGWIALVYLAVAALTAAIFMCPVHFTLKKNMKKF